MTRNTQLFKVKNGDNELICRDLTAIEISFLSNIKSVSMQREMAGRMCVMNVDPDTLKWQLVVQLGQTILERSNEIINNEKLEEIVINELRESVDYDYAFYLISKIKKVFPTESILELLNLNYKDLLELVVFAEKVSGQQILLSKEEQTKHIKKGRKLINPHDLPDGGASIQEAINKLNTRVGF